jgi:REP element-mobilizing transposase RayT
MARPLRIQSPDFIRHVMARGNGKMRIFVDDVDYRRFVYLLGDTLESSSIRCWNYCLMPNHYHLTVQPTHPNLSAAIRRLNSRYGLWWNRRHTTVGHVFQGRFKDQIVDREAYLITLSRYVVMNPVRAGLATRPEDWPWSSYRATAGLSPEPSFLDVEATLGLFGDGWADRQARFMECVGASEDPALTDRIRSGERVLGPFAFKTLVQANA